MAVVGADRPGGREAALALAGAAGSRSSAVGQVLALVPSGATVRQRPEDGLGSGIGRRPVDIASAAVSDALAGVDALVWLAQQTDVEPVLRVGAAVRRGAALRTCRALLLAAAAHRVRHVVVVTSAQVYGALPGGPVPIPEDAPLRAEPDDGLVGDLLAVERHLERARTNHPDMTVTVMRPAALVGPGVDTAVTRHFEAPRLLVVRGSEPVWQFCHVDDLAAAVRLLVDSGPAADGSAALPPAVTVAAPGSLTQRDVERRSGMRRIEVGAVTATSAATQLHRLGLSPSPPSELAYVTHPWVVDPATLRARGWRPSYDNETCLGVLLESVAGRSSLAGRRVDQRDVALGAASAAVAMLGTAAVLRRSRRR